MGGDRIPGPHDKAVDEETRRRREQHELHLEGKENEKKVQDALERAQVAWIQEFGRLDEIAVDVYNGKRGSFIKKFADAWLAADVFNKRMIKPAWVALIRKYKLDEDPAGTGALQPRQTP